MPDWKPVFPSASLRSTTARWAVFCFPAIQTKRARYKSSRLPNTCFTIKTAFRFWQPYILTATVNCMNWIFGKRISARYWLIRTNRNILYIYFKIMMYLVTVVIYFKRIGSFYAQQKIKYNTQTIHERAFNHE